MYTKTLAKGFKSGYNKAKPKILRRYFYEQNRIRIERRESSPIHWRDESQFLIKHYYMYNELY